MENIDHIFYINLEKRKDRNEEILKELEKMNLNINIERYNAVYRPENPCLGCTISHLNVIKLAKERRYKNVLIFEDDFQFIVDENTLKDNIDRFFKKSIDFRVLMLSYESYSKKDYDELISITNDSATASGYIVNQKYYDELINCLEYGSIMLERTGEHWNYINDQIWKRLQKDDKWFIFNKRLGVQRSSFSDLKNSFVNYGF
jgi:glycosyl transferase family 25